LRIAERNVYHELVIFSWTRPLLECILAVCMATEVGVIVFLRGTTYLGGRDAFKPAYAWS